MILITYYFHLCCADYWFIYYNMRIVIIYLYLFIGLCGRCENPPFYYYYYLISLSFIHILGWVSPACWRGSQTSASPAPTRPPSARYHSSLPPRTHSRTPQRFASLLQDFVTHDLIVDGREVTLQVWVRTRPLAPTRHRTRHAHDTTRHTHSHFCCVRLQDTAGAVLCHSFLIYINILIFIEIINCYNYFCCHYL